MNTHNMGIMENNEPILYKKAKMQLPLIPHKTLYSKRIQDLNIIKNRLSVLVAPAGCGKTTAVLLSLQDYREGTYWYRLEQEDMFLDIFYQNLIELLFAYEQQILEEEQKLLRSLQNLEEEYAILNAQICQDLSHIYRDETEPIFLVLDDWQWVSKRSAYRATMAYFIRNLPECIKIVITSRTDPELITGKLCLDSTCRQYISRELIFSAEEIETLISRVYGFSFSRQQLDMVVERSQGWAVVVYVLAHSLHNASGYNTEDIALYERESLFSGFFSEYLLGMSKETKNILIELSVFDNFSINELADFLRIDKAIDFIEWLTRNQLCSQTDCAGEIRYYFHALINDELRRLFKNSRPLSEQHAFYQSIADYYVDIDAKKAIGFYIQGESIKRAVEISAVLAREAFLAGRPESFVPILSLFTEEQISRNPELLLMDGMRFLNIDRMHAQISFMQALHEFKKVKDYAFLMNCFGMLLVVAFQMNNLKILMEAKKMLPVFTILFRGGRIPRTELLTSQFIYLVGHDRLSRAGRLARYLESRGIKEWMWHFSYRMIRGIFYYRTGDLEQSRNNMERILAHAVMQHDEQWRIIGLVSCCNVPVLHADQEKIQYFINEFSLLAERLRSDYALGYAHYMRSFLYHIQGDNKKALSAMEEAKEAYRRYGSKSLCLECDCFILALYERVEREHILKARGLIPNLKTVEQSHGIMELAMSTLAALLQRSGEYTESKSILQECISIAKKKGTVQVLYAFHLQMSDLCFEMDDKVGGVQHFRNWVALGRKYNYRYAMPFSHRALKNVLKQSADLSEECPYCYEMMEFYSKNRQISHSESPIEVSFFGAFSLKRDSHLLGEKDFKTRKVSGLLKYIMARNKVQSREKLACIFWPESSQKSANTSLRVALYELRKVLSSFEMGFDSEYAILEESKEGFALSTNHSILADTKQIEEFYAMWKQSKFEDEKSILLKICDCYKGSFLEGIEDDDWVIIQREYYSGIYYEALNALGEYAVREAYMPAVKYLLRGLEFDPLNESVCGQLVALYEKGNELERAESLRRKFIKRFKKEMGLEPNI